MFLRCQGPVSCCFKDKGEETSWRSWLLRYYSVTQKMVLRSVSAVAGVFWKHRGSEARGHGTRSVNSLYFPREEFSKGHSTHSHTNLHLSALSTVVYAPGVLSRNPAINQPRTECNIKKNLKNTFTRMQWQQLLFPDIFLCAVRHHLIFPPQV